ncbi:MAG: GntR family transcriptional regulator [Marinobacterium sp.]|nr:GntR family transcriptional regulator [Marinobacterium sp.]
MMQRQPLGDSVKIERTAVTLREKVLNALRNAILNFQLLPGDRLVERDLCDLLGVSRTSVREALRHLESEGLVEYLDGKGPRVATITMEDAREIYELRCSLECMIIELFTLRASDEQLLDLEYALRKLHSRLEAGEIVPILDAVNAFYEVLFEGSGNRTAANFLRQLQARISFLRATSVSQNNRYKDSSAEMAEIVEAIKTRDPVKAHEACLSHIKHAADVALKVLAEQQGDEAPDGADIQAPLQVRFPNS